MIHNDDPVLLHRTINRLKDIIALRDEQIVQLKEQVNQLVNDHSWSLPATFELTKKEARIVSSLYKANGRILSKPAIHKILYEIEDELTEIQIVDVFICRIRKKLSPFNLFITTIRGRGYLFEEPTIEALSAYGKSHLKENEINIPIPAMA